jgi:hypothetical protein
VPNEGKYLWEWFGRLNNSVSRIHDGVCKLIPPSEYLAWSALTGALITPEEYDILQAMDAVYCEETNKELKSQRMKREEEMKREVNEGKRRRR